MSQLDMFGTSPTVTKPEPAQQAKPALSLELWECACGWRGEWSALTVSHRVRLCPACSGNEVAAPVIDDC